MNKHTEARRHKDAGLTGLAARVLDTGTGATHDLIVRQLRVWHRLFVTAEADMPQTPSVVVTHHGFGGTTDLNIFAAIAIIEQRTGLPVKIMAHSRLWDMGLGRVLEGLGAMPAGHESAHEALESGSSVLVVPGGEHDAVKTWPERNTLTFHGHSGFVRLAREAGVPIVPVVTAGAGESLVVLSKGDRIAKIARRFSRKPEDTPSQWPVTITAPWGLTAGVSLVLPYLPLPSKLESVVLPSIRADGSVPDDEVAAALEAEMQETLTELGTDRTPLLGRLRRKR